MDTSQKEVKRWEKSGRLQVPRAARIGARYTYEEWKSRWENQLVDAFGLSTNEFLAGKRVLEVGCGLYGVIHFSPHSTVRVGIDPLCVEYSGKWLDSNVDHLVAVGESLPFRGGTFDSVVVWNVLDYCRDPGSILKEVNRVLRDEGSLVLLVVTYSNLPGRLAKHLSLLDHLRTKYFGDLHILGLLGTYDFNILVKSASLLPITSVLKSIFFNGFNWSSGLKTIFAFLVGMRYSYYLCSKKRR